MLKKNNKIILVIVVPEKLHQSRVYVIFNILGIVKLRKC